MRPSSNDIIANAAVRSLISYISAVFEKEMFCNFEVLSFFTVVLMKRFKISSPLTQILILNKPNFLLK